MSTVLQALALSNKYKTGPTQFSVKDESTKTNTQEKGLKLALLMATSVCTYVVTQNQFYIKYLFVTRSYLSFI
jgi:hypothetical protein